MVEHHQKASEIVDMIYQNDIEIIAGKRSGKPCVKGTRISVYDVLQWLASGMTMQDIVDDYPELTTQQVQACLAYAADRDRHSVIITA